MAVRRTMLFAAFAMIAASTATAQRWGHGSVPRDGVCFYTDTSFRGDYFCVRTGDELRFLPGGMNDRISSIKIFGRAEVTVYKDVDFDGRSTRFASDIRKLQDEGWDDLISSMRVRSSGGFGGGFGGRRPSAEDPDRIVRRAYQDILDRQPDPAGLRLYRSRIIDDEWTEAQVRDALRNSAEYREKNTMTYAKAQDIVRRAYLAVLKREPDPGSLPFVDKVLRDHWSQQDVERELRKSAEYRNKR